MNYLDGFMGFTYNGRHSSEFGIVRTSNGSRFDENLLPTIQDKIAQVPGGDGAYYFGSYYTQRQFNIAYAFNGLTEEQLNNLKRHFGDKKIHDLIFDESPYKVYSAKVTGSSSLKYIPFGEGETGRVYKGEGSFQFTCYYPYARSREMYVHNYEQLKIRGESLTEQQINEWKNAANWAEDYEKYNYNQDGVIKLYNPGIIDSPFEFYFHDDSADGWTIPAGTLKLADESKIAWNDIPVKSEDKYVVINTKNSLIEGYTDYIWNESFKDPSGNSINTGGTKTKKSGNIYNEYISSGSFFKIPQGESTLILEGAKTGSRPIHYYYYYF